MRITVNTEDIDAGRRRDPSECPVARALRRAGISHFGVTGMLVIIQTGRKHIPLVLPAQVQEWILDFDWGSAMAPIDFELNLPDEQEHVTVNGRAPGGDEELRLDLLGAAPSASVNCTRGGVRLPSLPRWSASAKHLLGRPFRRCPSRHKARGRASAQHADKLVPS